MKKAIDENESDEENEDPALSNGAGNGPEVQNDTREVDVVLTTYQSAVSSEQDRVALKKLGVGYAIFDEGHMLKNMNTRRYTLL